MLVPIPATHVAGNQKSRVLLEDAYMPRGMSRCVHHPQSPWRLTGQLDDLTVDQHAVHRDPGRYPARGVPMRCHRDLPALAQVRGAGNVVGVMMGQPDLAQATASTHEQLDRLVESRPVVGIGRSRIDDHQLAPADEIAIGMGRRRQGRGAQWRDEDARHDLVHSWPSILLERALDAALGSTGQARLQGAENPAYRRRNHPFTALPALQCLAGTDPPAIDQLATTGAKIEPRRRKAALTSDLDQVILGIEAHRMPCRGDEATGRYELDRGRIQHVAGLLGNISNQRCDACRVVGHSGQFTRPSAQPGRRLDTFRTCHVAPGAIE